VDNTREVAPRGYISLREYIDVRFASIAQAVEKAEAAAEKRFESINEMRGMVTDAASKYMPRTEYETAHKAIVEKVEGLQKMLWVGLGVILALQFLVSIMLIFWKSTK
jgi:predicted neutral ceramidase superfamily lipid hydrolase